MTNNFHANAARELRTRAAKTLNLARAHAEIGEINAEIERLEHRREMLETYLTSDGEVEPPAP